MTIVLDKQVEAKNRTRSNDLNQIIEVVSLGDEIHMHARDPKR